MLRVPYEVSTQDDWSEFVPSANLSWNFADESFVYFTAAKGYKSGAFVSSTTTPEAAVVALEPEIATNFELGLKTEFANNRVRLNASIFNMDYEDLQVFRLVGSLLVGANAEATSQGVELDLTALISESWVLSANYGYLDAEYDTFISGSDDFSGNTLPRSAKNSWSISSAYTFVISGGSTLDFELRYARQGDYFIEPSNAPGGEEEGFGLLDASLSWASADRRWEVAVWGKNLNDEEYRTHSIISNIAGTVDLWGLPRTYGVNVNVAFGG